MELFEIPAIFSSHFSQQEHVEFLHDHELPDRLMCTDCPQSFLTNKEFRRHVTQVGSWTKEL
jgi:hypothetical protein